eukprot:scaffold216817_cov50-Attheya_sp.AAC.1
MKSKMSAVKAAAAPIATYLLLFKQALMKYAVKRERESESERKKEHLLMIAKFKIHSKLIVTTIDIHPKA